MTAVHSGDEVPQDNDQGKAPRHRGQEEEQGQPRRLPQGRKAPIGEHVRRSQRGLMHGGEDDTGNHHPDDDARKPAMYAVPPPSFGHDFRELQEEHRRVQHDTDGHLEEGGMEILVQDGMPNAPGQPQVQEDERGRGKVADERGQDGHPEQGREPAPVEHLDHSPHREPGSCQGNGRKVEANPQPPRTPVGQVGRPSQAQSQAHQNGRCTDQRGNPQNPPNPGNRTGQGNRSRNPFCL